MQIGFASGIIWARPSTDVTGTAIANPTVQKFGALQDISLDISFDTKMLYGGYQFPIDVARGKGKATAKAKAALVNGNLLNALVFGGTTNAGTALYDYQDTAGLPIPASSPYTLTIAPPSTGTFAKDLGVRNATTGLPLTRVATPSVSGQYSVNESTGVYTFYSTDANTKVYIDYRYSATITNALNFDINNQPMGNAPRFGIDLAIPYQGKQLTFSFPNCMSNKLSFATKLDDYMIPEFDIDIFADPTTNKFGTVSTAE